jgi:hypothetical protein
MVTNNVGGHSPIGRRLLPVSVIPWERLAGGGFVELWIPPKGKAGRKIPFGNALMV